MPVGLNEAQLQRIDDVVATRRKIKRGSTLFRNGEEFVSLYAIRTGFFKTCVATEDGRDQVTGFQMAGEIIGLDGIVNDHHTCDAVALEDAVARLGEVAEGVNTLKVLKARAQALEVYMPLVAGLHAILFEGRTLAQVIELLMRGEPKTDVDFISINDF